eukprot:6186319-Pleurochrysis_carterae.AAC.2
MFLPAFAKTCKASHELINHHKRMEVRIVRLCHGAAFTFCATPCADRPGSADTVSTGARRAARIR